MELQGEINKGDTLIILLYRDPALFRGLSPGFRRLDTGVMERNIIEVDALPAGDYAIVVIVDSNKNGLIDRHFLGIPTEPIGFSNDYRPFGPPVYLKAKISLNDEEIRIEKIDVKRAFGKNGSVAVGLGAMINQSPYKGADSSNIQFIPAISYQSESLQILGPEINYFIGEYGGHRLGMSLVLSLRRL